MIDTHAHLTRDYYENLEEVLNESAKALKLIINSATNDIDSNDVIEVANQYDNIYACVGIHPTETGDVKNIEKLANNPQVIAIGEIGLDYYHKPVDKEEQKKKFIQQLEIAKKYKKPVIIHSREATNDVIEILKEYPDIKGIIHCFGGSFETAQIYIKMGYKIGIGGVLTFKNTNLVEVVKQLDLKDLVLETDAPFLSPEPYRGKTNYPGNVSFVYEKVAEIKGIELEKVVSIIEDNVSGLFDIKF